MGRLTDKYCIVGVGETSYSKNSGKTTRAMGAEAIRNAMRDAGLECRPGERRVELPRRRFDGGAGDCR